MQSIADYIITALSSRGVQAHMYLDNIIIVAPIMDIVERADQETLKILTGLGLQIAHKKLQPPATQVKWLGIEIDVLNNQFRIPKEKVAQIRRCMAAASGHSHITKSAS